MSPDCFVHVYCFDRALQHSTRTCFQNAFFSLLSGCCLCLLPSSLQLGLPPCVDKELFKNGLVEGKQEPESWLLTPPKYFTRYILVNMAQTAFGHQFPPFNTHPSDHPSTDAHIAPLNCPYASFHLRLICHPSFHLSAYPTSLYPLSTPTLATIRPSTHLSTCLSIQPPWHPSAWRKRATTWVHDQQCLPQDVRSYNYYY